MPQGGSDSSACCRCAGESAPAEAPGAAPAGSRGGSKQLAGEARGAARTGWEEGEREAGPRMGRRTWGGKGGHLQSQVVIQLTRWQTDLPRKRQSAAHLTCTPMCQLPQPMCPAVPRVRYRLVYEARGGTTARGRCKLLRVEYQWSHGCHARGAGQCKHAYREVSRHR